MQFQLLEMKHVDEAIEKIDKAFSNLIMDSAIRHFLDFEKISTNEVRHILDLGYKIT